MDGEDPPDSSTPTTGLGRRPSQRGAVKTVGRREKVEARARWIIERWNVRPSLRYDEMREEVRVRFEIGTTYAERSITRAYELMKEEFTAYKATERLFAKYMSLVETAERRGDLGEARRIMKDCRDHLGIGAPQRLHVTGKIEGVLKVDIDAMEELSDEELAILAKLDAAREPKAELEAQDSTADEDEDQGDSTLDGVTIVRDSSS